MFVSLPNDYIFMNPRVQGAQKSEVFRASGPDFDPQMTTAPQRLAEKNSCSALPLPC